MSEETIRTAHLGVVSGIQIIPSEDIRNGYKRTERGAIFVSPSNYEYLRPLSAKGVLIVLWHLREIGDK